MSTLKNRQDFRLLSIYFKNFLTRNNVIDMKQISKCIHPKI